MTYLISANVERLETVDFIVLNIYDDSGQLVEQTIKPFESYRQTVELIRDEMYVINKIHFDAWTSEPKLFGELIAVPGVFASLKHRDQTSDTKRAIEQVEDVLREIYEIPLREPLPLLPKWRRWLFGLIQNLANKLKGDGIYG
ncbi:hypothetical protein [Bacillus massiliglaciei]|uniref:hypothetical protein n=1 Tax=Bacillus massiliglaciei TaxID=1816693 RepID=UPI0018FF06D3|nr:hypothetical protein [Bacillus massiliglaciei]